MTGGCMRPYPNRQYGRHEMLNKINRDEVRAGLLGCISAGVTKQQEGPGQNKGVQETIGQR